MALSLIEEAHGLLVTARVAREMVVCTSGATATAKAGERVPRLTARTCTRACTPRAGLADRECQPPATSRTSWHADRAPLERKRNLARVFRRADHRDRAHKATSRSEVKLQVARATVAAARPEGGGGRVVLRLRGRAAAAAPDGGAAYGTSVSEWRRDEAGH